MTNFAACKSKSRSFAKQSALRETQSRATNRGCAQSVISGRLPFQSQTANGNQTGFFSSPASLYSGHSSSTLSRASTYQRQESTASTRSHQTSKYPTENCCCNSRADQLTGKHLNAHRPALSSQTDQTSVISLNFLVKTQKCGLCKEQIKYFREEFICGHAFHG